jgi:hypothetical protein
VRDHQSPGQGAGPSSDAIHLRVAFATERHARLALGTIAGRPDLTESVELSECGLPSCDLILLDITTGHDEHPQVSTLMHGLHGVLVNDGDRVLGPCFPKAAEPGTA